MKPDPEQAARLRAAIHALEAQRALLGDAVVDVAIGPLRAQLAALASSAPARRHQRRQVTVLFADITGYTTLSEHVDPERIGNMLGQFWGDVDALVRERRGRVYSHMGDGIMAVWSDTASSEDDAEQAVRTGLAMLEMIHSQGLLVAGTRVEAKMRVGINTGLAHVTDRDGQTATGDTVNVAARLQAAAEPGTLLISRSTFRQVRGVFEFADAGELALKGRAQPVQAYRVMRPLPRAFPAPRRGIEGVDTDLVGRAAPRQVLRARLLRATRASEPSLTVLVGEPGIGKSRMLSECRDMLETGIGPVRYFEGRAYLDSMRQPYALLRNIISHRFQIGDDEDPVTAIQKLAVGVSGLIGPKAGRMADSLGWLLGLAAQKRSESTADSTYRRNAAIRDTIDFFAAVAAGDLPAMLFLDDLQWADDASLDLLEQVLAAAAPGLSLIVAARPALLSRRPAWGADGSLHARQTALHLDPLDAAAAGRLVDQILAPADHVPPALRERLVAQSSGNPFHLEELIRMLIDDGVISTRGPWRIDMGRLDSERVPDTLVGVLQGRLDHLDAAEFRVLQVASVFGRCFWDSALAAVLHEMAGPDALPIDVPAVLQSLLGAELIYRVAGSRFGGAAEAEFRHDVLRAVAYDTLPLDERPRLHRCAADWLVPAAGDRGDEHALVIAEHLDKAVQRSEAADWYLRAARRAAAQALFTDALRLFAEAVDRLEDPARRIDVLLEQIYTMVTAGRHDDAKCLLQPMLAPDSRVSMSQQLRARSEMARIHALRDGDFQTAERLLLDGIALLPQVAADDPSHHLLQHQLGILQITVGRYSAAVDTLTRLIQHPAKSIEERRCRGWTLNALAHTHAHLGDSARAIALSQDADRLARENNDPRTVMAAIAQRGLVARQAGDWALAYRLFGEAQQLNHRHADIEKTATVASYLGEAALALGDVDGARAHFHEAGELSSRAGIVTELVRGVLGLAAVAARLGQRDLAALALRVACRHPAAGGEARRLAGWIEATCALPPTAPSAADPPLEAMREQLAERLQAIRPDTSSQKEAA
jgi:class 3 adenylate cyclase/tetratricopeptide (TPR) repeat protein